MKARFSLLLSVFLICAPVALHAEIDPSEAAEAAILELEAAATALANAESASDRIAALTQTIKGYERGLLNLREAVRRAALSQRAIESRLDTESAELSVLLMAMQQIAAEPSPVGLMHPNGPVASAPAALVTSPWFGAVRYAGPLLDYGNVVILEPEGNILMILAGLGDLYVTAGTVIAQGAPLGMMPSAAGARADLITETPDQTGAALSETIYIEVRQDGGAIDPQPWFNWE